MEVTTQLIPAQHGPEAGLLEVVVAGQGPGEAAIGHHDERDAIVLVHESEVEEGVGECGPHRFGVRWM